MVCKSSKRIGIARIVADIGILSTSLYFEMMYEKRRFSHGTIEPIKNGSPNIKLISLLGGKLSKESIISTLFDNSFSLMTISMFLRDRKFNSKTYTFLAPSLAATNPNKQPSDRHRHTVVGVIFFLKALIYLLFRSTSFSWPIRVLEYATCKPQ